MNTGTWNTVLSAVEAQGVGSAADIATHADLSATTVRRYLAEMTERGLVETTIGQSYSDSGRGTPCTWYTRAALLPTEEEANIHPTEIKGTVTLSDGSTTEFILQPGYGWQQWGNTTERLGDTGELMDALMGAAVEAGLEEAADE